MEELKISDQNKEKHREKADQLAITYYTDPLCCWSWGMEPPVIRLQEEYFGRISLRYCMAGVLPSWKNYHDEINSVSRPVQMGPVWMHAQQLTGMPMRYNIWITDPPASSYPACIAVKAVELQSAILSERYLRLLREALMVEGKNISKEAELINVGKQLEKEFEGEFDMNKFTADLKNDNGLEAFRKDQNEIQSFRINRYPSFVFKNPAGNAIIITGYRPYSELEKVVQQIMPEWGTNKD